jgi:hypothetical protein
VSYSIIVNGSPTRLFYPSRGIRQGDLLSPYLFILCAKVLSQQLQKAESIGLLKGVPTSFKGIRLNHLFFVYDSLLFCKATEGELSQMRRILEMYEEASSQRLNNDKTTIFFSRNTDENTWTRILQLVEVPASQRYDKYVGLPTSFGREVTGPGIPNPSRKSGEKGDRLEHKISVSSEKRNFVESGRSGHTYLQHEYIFTPKGAL